MSDWDVVFFHAHPDDEAIFTGGTCARLAAEGYRPIVILATSGEGGLSDEMSRDHTARLRRSEAEAAAALIGAQVIFLGYPDSGLYGEHDDGFAHLPLEQTVDHLAVILRDIDPAALVVYDDNGIYGHPDHIQVNQVGRAAAAAAAIDTVYLSTVDREYLHFVETHVVVDAGLPDRATGLRLSSTTIGQPTVLIDLAIDVEAFLPNKRAAMAAHASQLPDESQVMRLTPQAFAAVYRWEWYCRQGPTSVLDQFS